MVVDAHVCTGTWFQMLILILLVPFYGFFCFYKRSLHTKKLPETHGTSNPASNVPAANYSSPAQDANIPPMPTPAFTSPVVATSLPDSHDAAFNSLHAALLHPESSSKPKSSILSHSSSSYFVNSDPPHAPFMATNMNDHDIVIDKEPLK